MRKLLILICWAALVLGSVTVTGCGGSGGSKGSGDAGTTTDGTTTDGTTTEGTTTEGTTTEGTTTEGTTTAGTTDGIDCATATTEQLCQNGSWQCGPDGCGGSCGACPPGFQCKNSLHICVEVVEPEEGALYGESCGRKGDCQPTIIDTNGQQVENPAWQACKNSQCETNYCMDGFPVPAMPVCSKQCNITKDEVDAEGNPGADSVEDPDTSFNDCAGSADGPYGTQWNCVNLAEPGSGQAFAVCLPGTTFAKCASNGDCPPNESCQLMQVGGELGLYCAGVPKGGKGSSQTCNLNPEEGDLELCEANLCFGMGCVGFCSTDADCYTFEEGKGCVDGKCADDPNVSCATDVDCSAWYCDPQHNISSEENPILNDTCWPKTCGTNPDCPDSDFHCAISSNGQINENFAWEHLCLRSPDDAGALGDECETDPEDNVPLPGCGAGPCLTSGVCSSICENDGDCADATQAMLCNQIEYGLDYDGDGQDDDGLAPPFGLCFGFPGSQNACAKDGDCPEGEACNFHSYINTSGNLDAKGVCTTPSPGEGDIGDTCGADTGVTCKSGFCLGQDTATGQPGYCTAICSGNADCPKDQSLGAFQGSYDLVCRSLLYSFGGSLDDQTTNVWLPLCVPIAPATNNSSFAACDASTPCAEGESCIGFAVSLGSSAGADLETFCISNKDFEGTAPTGNYGDKCDLSEEDTNGGVSCKDLYCMNDIGTDNGYCSKMCTTDADCSSAGPDFVCDTMVLMDKPGDANDAIIPLCKKKKSCIPCFDDNSCAGDYVCINAGGQGLQENRVCAPPCTTDAECAGTDGGNTCKMSYDGKGKPENKSSCEPASCN